MGMVLGIDIGGTSIKAGLFTESGTLVSTKKIPTGKIVNEDAFAAVIGGLEELLFRDNPGIRRFGSLMVTAAKQQSQHTYYIYTPRLHSV